jgi:hypothetical protein
VPRPRLGPLPAAAHELLRRPLIRRVLGAGGWAHLFSFARLILQYFLFLRYIPSASFFVVPLKRESFLCNFAGWDRTGIGGGWGEWAEWAFKNSYFLSFSHHIDQKRGIKMSPTLRNFRVKTAGRSAAVDRAQTPSPASCSSSRWPSSARWASSRGGWFCC